ncbi:NUDIX hydrolase [Candidatus Uhrbacteria bacterium]|nr:NUDIX hydrolase [Candidatus Uhrbacteria bacterium]
MGEIPTQAKRVFKGQIFDVYQWEQEMYDGTKEIFEKLRRSYTVEIIATTPEGKIIIQRQEQPDSDIAFLSLVGGRIEEGEDPLEAAHREMLEETGYASELWTHLDTYDGSNKVDWKNFIYAARNCEKISEQHLDPGERIEVLFVTFDEFIELVDSHQLKRVCETIREKCIRAKYDPASREAFYRMIYG